MLNTNQVLRS